MLVSFQSKEQKANHLSLVTVKAFFVPVAGVAFLIWTLVKAHGAGPIIHEPIHLHGSELGWTVVSGIMSSIANFATLIVNDRKSCHTRISYADYD